MNRRDFLKTAVAFVPGAAIAQTALPPKARIASSVALWTLKGTLEAKLEIAARAGVQSVDLNSERDGWPDTGAERVKKLCRSFDLDIDCISGTFGSGDRVDLLGHLREALATARELEAPRIAFAGKPVTESAKRAADLAAQAGVTVLLKPRNLSEGCRMVREVDNPHFQLAPGIYDAQADDGAWMESFTQAIPYTAVIRIADAPGRIEPGAGKLDFPAIYKAIMKSGFQGCLCMEYFPAGDPVASLIRSFNAFRAATAA